MASIVIRPAVESDVPAIARIVHDAFGGFIPLLGRAPMPMFEDYRANVAQGAVWVLTEDDAIAGIALLKFGEGHLLANPIAIAPEFQGKGHGRQLFAFIEDEARRRGCSEIRMHVHMGMSPSIAFCKARGYAEYRRAGHDGYVLVCLRKQVAPAA